MISINNKKQQSSIFNLLIILALISAKITEGAIKSSCYDSNNKPIKCFPSFVNVAFKKPVKVTNTCGEDGEEIYCWQEESTKTAKSCHYCDSNFPENSHPSSFLTDPHFSNNKTWWQSSSMTKNMQYPNSVNLTLNLGKAFEVTYVRLVFASSRPESMVIYKRNSYNKTSPWEPYQYFSGTCEQTYDLYPNEFLRVENEDKALCKEDQSDISPLSGGTVIFSTLEGRPGAQNFDHNTALQDWVSATDIKISLNRINTFGDEVFGDPQVLSQYFYAIYDFAVGGRCKCNGHASECVLEDEILKCVCEHNTAGVDCEKCLPFYNDKPWGRATLGDANECQACDCNGLSETCEFDLDLFQRSGHGGHCINCRENTHGPHCENCAHGFFHHPSTRRCIDCGCHGEGSENIQCNERGICRCKPGVEGEKCDRCISGYYNLSQNGCSPCQCNFDGIVEDKKDFCDPFSGQCNCKEFVGGRRCDQCKEGYFGLIGSNPLGCYSCFCYGHSKTCSAERGASLVAVTSNFISDQEGWKGENQGKEEVTVEHLDISREISIVANDNQANYFIAPDQFNGDNHFSQDHYLTFDLRLDLNNDYARPSHDDVIIQGANGRTLTVPIFSQNNPIPSEEKQNYKFFLNEHPDFQWSPQGLSHYEFARILSNVTSIKIRGTYTNQGVGFLSNVKLETINADLGKISTEPLSSQVISERCQCPPEYIGQFCEVCAPGKKRLYPFSGPYGPCVDCQCHNHSDFCEPESGRCICSHFTQGDQCDNCLDGYYGNPLHGSAEDCKPCGCPDGGKCLQVSGTDEIICLDCPEGYGGSMCDECEDGYFGSPCIKCYCNNNIDPNDIATCNRISGECIKCQYNTTGFYCENCLPGYYGSPIKEPHGECQACECLSLGTHPEEGDGGEIYSCDIGSGQCRCKENVVGRSCDQCLEGTWDLYSGNGCKDCSCNPIGSVNGSCDIYTGQCTCKPGITGIKCDICLPYHYGYSLEGCKECKCDYYGSKSMDCDLITGQCTCKINYRSRMCDKCQINKFNIQAGCLDCPVCYNIVMNQVLGVESQIQDMNSTLDQAQNLPADYLENDEKLKKMADELNFDIDDKFKRLTSSGRANELRWIVEVEKELEKNKNILNNSSRSLWSSRTNLSSIYQPNLKTSDELTESLAEELFNETNIFNEKEEIFENKLKDETKSKDSDDLTQYARDGRTLVDSQSKNLEILKNLTDEIKNNTNKLGNSLNEYNEIKKNYLLKLNQNYESQKLANQTLMNLEEGTKSFGKNLDEILNSTGIILEKVELIKMPMEEETKKLVDDSKDIINRVKIIRTSMGEINKKLEEERSHFYEYQVNISRNSLEMKAEVENRNNFYKTFENLFKKVKLSQNKSKEISMETNRIVNVLKEFDQRVETHKQESLESKKLIPEIEKNTEEATRLEGEASALFYTDEKEKDSLIVHDFTVETKDRTVNKTKDFESLDELINDLDNDTSIIKEKSDGVLGELEKMEKLLEELENDEGNHEEVVQKTQELTNEASMKSEGVNKKEEDIKTKIDHVTRILDHVNIEKNKLENITKNLEELKSSVDILKANDIFNNIENQSQYWEKTVKNYEEEIYTLRSAVENLRTIGESIPNKCLNPVVLEPTQR